MQAFMNRGRRLTGKSPLALESCTAANEPPEALLSWPPMVRYLDACILRAVKPWSGQLGADDFGEIRTRVYVWLSLDPELRGLLRRVAVELERCEKRPQRALAPRPGAR